MEQIRGTSKDIVADNIKKLRGIFPEIFCEDKIDFEKFQEVFGDYIEDKEERYKFEWNGKSKAIRISQNPSTGTLRPCKDESKNWDTTENLYIEGDNLEVLKLLQKSYQNKIKMIYIDPPYNTGNDFVYKDDYKDNITNYLSITGQVDNDGKKISTNSEVSGRYHTDWLNMMYPRLRLAKNLLNNEGVIFISIDDNELFNLKKVCDELFGEENFIGNFIWNGGRKNDSKKISVSHEYILVYGKNITNEYSDLTIWKERKDGIDEIYSKYDELRKKYNDNWTDVSKGLKEWYSSLSENNPAKKHKHYNFADENGIYFASDLSGPDDGRKSRPKYNVLHPITQKNVAIPARGWRWEESRMIKEISLNRVHFGKDETSIPNGKVYLKENEYQAPSSVFYKDRRSASSELKQLFNDKVFDFPKDVGVLINLISLIARNNDIVLDFFSGSGSFGEAVMRYNLKNKSNVRFILIQLQEKLKVDSKQYKLGYKNICDIAKERIRRAGNKLTSKNEEFENFDNGFKVFKLDSSNIKTWNADYDNLEQSFDDILNNFVDNRTEEDVVYEIMLKYGIDLAYPVEERIIEDKKLYSIGFGALIICLDNDITLEIVNEIISIKNELEPEVCRVVFKDNGFISDSVKTNAVQILKKNNIREVMSI